MSVASQDRPQAEQPSQSPTRPSPRTALLVAILLAFLVAAVFYPVWNYEFIDFDTYVQVLQNPYIRAVTLSNLEQIFTSRCIASYYPVRTLTFMADCQIWGLRAGGFKITNVLIHFTNALLVFWLSLRLFGRSRTADRPERPSANVAAAGFAAAVFAIHPVVVEPVVWIPGREELLMTLGALATLHFHVSARRAADAALRGRAVGFRLGAIAACAAACLSNAVGAVIPALVMAWDLLFLEKHRLRRTLLSTAPLWAIAIATILGKALGQSQGGVATVLQTSRAGRLMIGLNAYWLDLKTLVWPSDLALHYNWLWPRGFGDPEVLLGAAAVLATLAMLWLFRRQRLAVLGIVWFVVGFVPTSQLVVHHIHRADRFLYLPLVGLALAVAAGVQRWIAGPRRRSTLAATAGIATAILVALSVKASLQVGTWHDSLSVWSQCIVVDPNNARAHDVLADNLTRKDRFPEAMNHYEKAMAIMPGNVESMINYAERLALADPEFRDTAKAIRLATAACELTAWASLEHRRKLSLAYACRAAELLDEEEYAQAIQDFRHAINADPTYSLPLFNLAILLSTCPDRQLRRPHEAVLLAEEAHRVTDVKDVNTYLVLSAAYAEAGRYRAAAGAVRSALEIARQHDPERVTELQQQLEQYERASQAASKG